MTDIISDFLTSVVVAIIITIPIIVVFVLSGINKVFERPPFELPLYQLALAIWVLTVIIVIGCIRFGEPKMYEV